MAGDELNITRIKRTYTLDEAIEYMKRLDKDATTHTIRWVNARTGRPVSIGYT